MEVLRYFNRIQKLHKKRLPKIILNWDFIERKRGWLSDVDQITNKLGLDKLDMDTQGYDLETVRTLV